MMNEKWEEQFREQIHELERSRSSIRERSTVRHTRESPVDSEAMHSMIRQSTCCVSEWQAGT